MRFHRGLHARLTLWTTSRIAQGVVISSALAWDAQQDVLKFFRFYPLHNNLDCVGIVKIFFDDGNFENVYSSSEETLECNNN